MSLCLFYSSVLPHNSGNWINCMGGIPCTLDIRSHCACATMRHGWIYVEPLWYTQLSDRGARTVQRAERKPLSCRSDWTLTKVLHSDLWNSSGVLQIEDVCVRVTWFTQFISHLGLPSLCTESYKTFESNKYCGCISNIYEVIMLQDLFICHFWVVILHNLIIPYY